MAKKVAKTAATMKAPMKKAAATMKAEKASMKATNVKKVIHEDIAIAVAQTLNMTYNLNIDISKGASYPRVTSFLVHQLGEAGLSIVHL